MEKLLLLREGVFFKVSEVEVGEEIELETYYKNLDCEHIDIVEPYGLDEEGRRKYCLIVDDEALLKENPQINFFGSLLYGVLNHNQPLAGKVLVGKNKYTKDGLCTVGLEEEDVKYILERLKKIRKDLIKKA